MEQKLGVSLHLIWRAIIVVEPAPKTLRVFIPEGLPSGRRGHMASRREKRKTVGSLN